jgi:hypothetical protein
MNAQSLKAGLVLLLREFSITSSTLREKGGHRFSKAFMFGAVLVLGSYALIYSPPQKKSSLLARRIEAAKARAEFGEQYKTVADQLGLAYKRLPADSDRAQWLSNSIRDSLSAGGLVTEDFNPVRETENGGLYYQVSMVSVKLRFSEFFDWLLRIEAAQPMMHVQSVEIMKKLGPVGVNTATIEVATVIPKQRYR